VEIEEMSGKKIASWSDADSQWLWEERLRRQERRDRIERGELVVRGTSGWMRRMYCG